ETTKELPAASTAVVLSPVAMPDGSGFGPSSAKHGVASAANMTANIPAAKRMARTDTDDGRRRRRRSGSFVMGLLLFLFCAVDNSYGIMRRGEGRRDAA